MTPEQEQQLADQILACAGIKPQPEVTITPPGVAIAKARPSQYTTRFEQLSELEVTMIRAGARPAEIARAKLAQQAASGS